MNKLKAKGGGKFKYMAERDMLDLAAKFAPYRYVSLRQICKLRLADSAVAGVSSCGICGGLRMLISLFSVVETLLIIH